MPPQQTSRLEKIKEGLGGIMHPFAGDDDKSIYNLNGAAATPLPDSGFLPGQFTYPPAVTLFDELGFKGRPMAPSDAVQEMGRRNASNFRVMADDAKAGRTPYFSDFKPLVKPQGLAGVK